MRRTARRRRSGRGRQTAGKAGIEVQTGNQKSKAVRAEDAQTFELLANPLELGFQGPAGGARFAESRRNDDYRAGPRGGDFFDHGRDRGGRNSNDRQVDGLRQVGHASIRTPCTVSYFRFTGKTAP